MNAAHILRAGAFAILASMALGVPASAATTVQVGASGQTYASTAVQCTADPTTGVLSATVEVGLYKPKKNTTATVSLNGTPVTTLTFANPFVNVQLADGDNTVVATVKKMADQYMFFVQPGHCSTSENTISTDGTLEYAASGKSYATLIPGCALNPASGEMQRYINLFDNGTYLLNVSVNGVPLTQLNATHPHTPVFLSAGWNVIAVANGTLSTDYYVRDGGDGACLPDTSGNTFSADGTLEYAASGKSYATVTPGCATNIATGQLTPYVNLVDNGTYLLNVSVNGVPLTQLSATRPHTPVFLRAGLNVISVANGTLSIDYYVRNGGTGTCTLP